MPDRRIPRPSALTHSAPRAKPGVSAGQRPEADAAGPPTSRPVEDQAPSQVTEATEATEVIEPAAPEHAAGARSALRAEQPRNPLHGITLARMLDELHAWYGWRGLAERIPLRSFSQDPSITSSLKLLRKTPWAREKLEALYLFMLREQRRATRSGRAGGGHTEHR